MNLVSHNLMGYIPIPKTSVIRINIAWCKNLPTLIDKLKDAEEYDVFLDFPEGRSKPPRSPITLEDLRILPMVFKNIKHFAISNVERQDDLTDYIHLGVSLVPKIETVFGCENIDSIVNGKQHINYIMIDHGDLYNDMILTGKEDKDMYRDYIDPLVSRCKAFRVKALRERGLVFSDENIGE